MRPYKLTRIGGTDTRTVWGTGVRAWLWESAGVSRAVDAAAVVGRVSIVKRLGRYVFLIYFIVLKKLAFGASVRFI